MHGKINRDLVPSFSIVFLEDNEALYDEKPDFHFAISCLLSVVDVSVSVLSVKSVSVCQWLQWSQCQCVSAFSGISVSVSVCQCGQCQYFSELTATGISLSVIQLIGKILSVEKKDMHKKRNPPAKFFLTKCFEPYTVR